MVVPAADRALQHAVCFTADEAATTSALRAVLGAGDGPLTWEAGTPALIGALVGTGSGGTVEVVPLPPGLRRAGGGVSSVSFAVDDLDARVAACRAAGLDVTVAPGPAGDGLAYAVVEAAGLEFELVQLSP